MHSFFDLQYLVMDDINYLSDKHIGAICRRLTNLKYVSLWSSARHLSSFTFKQLSHCAKLTTLKFDSNRMVTDDVMISFFVKSNDELVILLSVICM